MFDMICVYNSAFQMIFKDKLFGEVYHFAGFL